jgi:2'-5' RNA ligase
MRCFIAVDLAEELKQKVINLQEQLPKDGLKLVEKENMHFTLKFLGEIDEESIKKVSQQMRQVAATTKPFTILISGIGVFPNENYIRVVWLGGDNEDKDFIKLHQAVDDIMADIFKKEKPVPHLTLARVTKKINLAQFIADNRSTAIGEMTVERIKLKKSDLTRKGPIYEDVEVFDLKG